MIIAENVMKFLNGEITWAQVEGITEDQATRFMEVGTTYLATQRFDEAEKVFKCLADINPKDADAHALLASTYQAQERPAEAIAAFGEALKMNPKHLVALAARGELRMKEGDRGGLDDLKRAAEIDPMGTTASGKRAAQLVRALVFRSGEARASR